MSYIVDITQENIKQAMSYLGIYSDELLLKGIDDYSEKDAPPEVKRLRFKFIRRKQKELARRINEYLSELYMKQLKHTSKASETIHDPQFTRKTPSPTLKVKQKHKELIEKYLANVQNNIKTTKNLETKLKQGEKLRKQLKNSLFNKRKSKVLALETRKIENSQARSATTVKQRHVSEFQESLTPKAIIQSFSNKRPRRNSENQDEQIANRIQKFEEKMEKSEQNKALYTKFIKDSASKFTQRVFKSVERVRPEKLENDEKTWKFIQKLKDIQKRRQKIKKFQTESRMRQQKMDAERQSKTQAKLEQYEKDLKNKVLKLREKEKKRENFLNEKLEKKQKFQVLQNELNRLREDEVQKNLERKKRAQ